MTQAAAEIGHNNPPSDIDILGERMKEKYRQFFTKAEELLAAQSRLPTIVNDDETAGKVGDFVKQLQGAIKNLEAARKSEKEEYVAAGKRVDGFFKVRFIDKLDLLKNAVSQLNADYLKRKEDARRQKEEEEAERLRVESAEKLAESQRKEEEARKKQAEAEAESRRIAEEAAKKEAEIKAESERKQKELQDKIDALEREKAEKATPEAKEEIKAVKEELKEVKAETREAIKEVKAETKEQETAVKQVVASAKSDLRESKTLLNDAARTDKQAERTEKLAGSSAANLARTRGEEGSVSTIETRWVGTVTNRNLIDYKELGPHFTDDDVQIALNRWVNANKGKQLPGAYIREETKATVR